MKKKLLLLILPMLFLTVALQAQDIKYWDFGAKDLGAGYENMLPVEHINALSARLLHVDWVDASGAKVVAYAEGVGYKAQADGDSGTDWQMENGESVESIYNKTFDSRYAAMKKFQIYSGKDDGNGGVFISGSSAFTKPTLLPDLDGEVNMSYMKDSTNDRILTVNTELTRYDERTDMPDNDADSNLLPGCIQFTSAGEKRQDRSGGRGFSMYLKAGEYLTVIGAGEYGNIDDEGDPVRYGYSTGYFQFQDYGGTGVPVEINDWGTGKGNPEGPIDGSDTGDESVRVMEFQAPGAGTYILRNRGYKIRIYRMYVSSTSIKSSVENNVLGVEDLVSNVSTNLSAIGNRIYISNVTTKTEVNIYSITGALVKSFNTNEDTNFEFKSGLWIATVKTAEGQKSVKLITK